MKANETETETERPSLAGLIEFIHNRADALALDVSTVLDAPARYLAVIDRETGRARCAVCLDDLGREAAKPGAGARGVVVDVCCMCATGSAACEPDVRRALA